MKNYIQINLFCVFFFFKQKTAYEIRPCDWSSDVCSSDLVWVATSKLSGDDSIEAWCNTNQVSVWRGSETDVLSRFVGCAEASGADVLLRLTGDCPFLDPQVIGSVARLMK